MFVAAVGVLHQKLLFSPMFCRWRTPAKAEKKLKHRKSDLEDYAARYYYTLAKLVDVNGSKGNEYFEIKGGGKNTTAVNVYRMDSRGQKEATPYYHRVFNRQETKRITLYGFGGNDIFDTDK